MAAVRNGNTWYVDASDSELVVQSIKVIGILLTAGGTDSTLLIGDASSDASYPNKLSIKAASGTTEQIRLENTPVVFPNGIRVKSLTSGATATFITTTAGN